MKKLLIIVNDPGFFLSHRLPIAIAAKDNDYDVHIASMGGDKAEEIQSHGFQHHTISLTRSGTSLWGEFKTIKSIWKLLSILQPNVVHLVTIKPVLYGGIISRIQKIPCVVSAISGLGFVFGKNKGIVNNLVRSTTLFLYRLSLSHTNQHVIFQNETDLHILMDSITNQSSIISGSGVNLNHYKYSKEPDANVPIISLAARLLKEKGIYEFVEASRILKSRNVNARFLLIGSPDPGNPSSIQEDELVKWNNEGVVECLGYQSNIAQLFSDSHIVTLPSYYREGLPKVLIEAAACGRAIVTTDFPGCKDAITPEKTGLLVEPKNPTALANSLEWLIENPHKRQEMGKLGRALAEKKYSINDVVQKHLRIYDDLLNETSSYEKIHE